MAEGVLFSIAEGIIGSLGSAALQENIGSVCGVKKDVRQLKDTLLQIRAVLVDAEKKQNLNNGVKVWLERLEDAANDADNLLDEISTQSLRRRVRSGNNNITNKVHTFFSTSNQIAFRLKMARKIKDIKEALQNIATARIQFSFHEILEETTFMNRVRETHSFVPEENVIGRDDEKVMIIKLLSDGAYESTSENVSIISIVGMGGLGKTTLAQLVFNDQKVHDHFELRIWICVSDAFDVRSLVEKILVSATNNEIILGNSLDQLQKNLREKISGKRFLIVLDDTWNENLTKWQELKDLLMHGRKGSKIMLTTRSDLVARAAGLTTSIFRLRTLDEDKSWDLFKKIAFEGGLEPNDSRIVKTGIDIVKKCRGIPLAIKTIGKMLYFKNPETDWPSFLETEISKVPQEQDDILPTLKLSYDHLPSNLKHCFAYCSLFPKDYEIQVSTLIYLWMAQGFITLSAQHQCFEDVGYDYFKSLLSRSFFEEVEISPWGTVETFKMHDLMHDLAVLVAGKKCSTLSLTKSEVDEKALHVSLQFNPDSQWQIPTSLLEAKKVRSIVMPTIESEYLLIQRSLPKSFFEEIISKFKFLRTLDLPNLEINSVPDSVGKLKHLRSLDLSHNSNILELPNSISKLQNLQKLDLTRCSRLKELPRDISKLISLRSLKIDGCNSLAYMPRGLGDLTNLQILSQFIVRRNSDHNVNREVADLSELMGLNNLRRKLVIPNLRHGMEFKPEYIAKKHRLQSLELSWEDVYRYIGIHGDNDEAVALTDGETLEGFQPLSSLKFMSLFGYGGANLPDSFSSLLLNVNNFTMRDCWNCLLLPQFCSLKKLRLENLHALEYIMKDTDPSATLPFLEDLYFRNLLNLKGWWKEDPLISSTSKDQYGFPSFSRLSSLYLNNCPKLSCMPLYPTLVEKLTLGNTSWEPFIQTIKLITNEASSSSSTSSASSSSSSAPLSKLKHLHILGNWHIESLPDWFGSLSSLATLQLIYCPKLKTLCPGIQHLTSLQELTIRRCEELDIYGDNTWQPLIGLTLLNLESLPQLVDLPVGLQQLPSLQHVRVFSCEGFKSNQWGSANSAPQRFMVDKF